MAAPEPTIRRRVIVRGLVHGVFFRDTCRERATASGVAGSVANRDDGSVEIVLEGPAEGVNRVLAWARRGPDSARVEQVEVSEERPVGAKGAKGFTVQGPP